VPFFIFSSDSSLFVTILGLLRSWGRPNEIGGDLSLLYVISASLCSPVQVFQPNGRCLLEGHGCPSIVCYFFLLEGPLDLIMSVRLSLTLSPPPYPPCDPHPPFPPTEPEPSHLMTQGSFFIHTLFLRFFFPPPPFVLPQRSSPPLQYDVLRV